MTEFQIFLVGWLELTRDVWVNWLTTPQTPSICQGCRREHWYQLLNVEEINRLFPPSTSYVIKLLHPPRAAHLRVGGKFMHLDLKGLDEVAFQCACAQVWMRIILEKSSEILANEIVMSICDQNELWVNEETSWWSRSRFPETSSPIWFWVSWRPSTSLLSLGGLRLWRWLFGESKGKINFSFCFISWFRSIMASFDLCPVWKFSHRLYHFSHFTPVQHILSVLPPALFLWHLFQIILQERKKCQNRTIRDQIPHL